MKSKRELLFWTIEFIAIIAIGVIPSLPRVAKLWLAVPAAVVVLTKFFEHRANIRDDHKRIREQLEVLMALFPIRNDHVRCTYHVPAGKQLLQLFDYLPNGGGGGRKFPMEKGIIGAAFREKRLLVENFRDDLEYRNKMKLRYNYTTYEIAERSADRRSYLCSPILDEYHKVLGLVYFDSDTYGAFELNGNPRITMITAACGVMRTHLL